MCKDIAIEMEVRTTKEVIKFLSDSISYEIGKEELTLNEMSKRCGISQRKLCEIIYKEEKGLNVETLLKVCGEVNIKVEMNQT